VKAKAGLKKPAQAHPNPAVFQHRDSHEHAYGSCRGGMGLFTPQYQADLKALERWLTDLEATLGNVPGYFDKAP
jgi:hypothetical protein